MSRELTLQERAAMLVDLLKKKPKKSKEELHSIYDHAYAILPEEEADWASRGFYLKRDRCGGPLDVIAGRCLKRIDLPGKR